MRIKYCKITKFNVVFNFKALKHKQSNSMGNWMAGAREDEEKNAKKLENLMVFFLHFQI